MFVIEPRTLFFLAFTALVVIFFWLYYKGNSSVSKPPFSVEESVSIKSQPSSKSSLSVEKSLSVKATSSAENPFGKAYSVLFDASQIPSLREWELVTVVFFNFVFWLIGGGLILSYIQDKNAEIENRSYRIYNPQWLGKLRWLKCLFGWPKFIIVFGWNSSAFSFVSSHYDKNNGLMVIVLTLADPQAVETVLDDIDEKLHVIVYRCDFDDMSELEKHLNMHDFPPVAVYVAGEEEVSLHDSHLIRDDSRVLQWAEKLKEKIPRKKIFCDVHDFGLAEREGKKGRYKIVDFHRSWADYFVANVRKKGKKKIAVVGLGAMGLAVVLSVIRKKIEKGKLKNAIEIWVTDYDESASVRSLGKFQSEYARFVNQYEEEKRYVIPISWTDFKERSVLKATAFDFIVIAKRRSEKGWSACADIIEYAEERQSIGRHYLREKEFLTAEDVAKRCWLNLEIEGPGNDKDNDEVDVVHEKNGSLTTHVCEQPVKVFGLKRGAFRLRGRRDAKAKKHKAG